MLTCSSRRGFVDAPSAIQGGCHGTDVNRPPPPHFRAGGPAAFGARPGTRQDAAGRSVRHSPAGAARLAEAGGPTELEGTAGPPPRRALACGALAAQGRPLAPAAEVGGACGLRAAVALANAGLAPDAACSVVAHCIFFSLRLGQEPIW